jgi:hypothetical protein
MDKFFYYAAVGLIVSMDVMALTLAKPSTFRDPWPTLIKWAALNAAWHAGLLVIYVFFFDVLVDGFKWTLNMIDLDWIRINLPAFLADILVWTIAKLRLHIFTIFAFVAMILVWQTYSSKIVDKPLVPDVARLPFWIRPAFAWLNRMTSHDLFNLNLQAALVAVDMLALAALIKASATETDASVNKFFMTIVVGASVFVFTWACIWFARNKLSEDRVYIDGTGNQPSDQGRAAAKMWILVTLRLLEPLLIFYFLIQLLATMATRIQVDSPALLFAAVLLVLAIIQIHGLARICDAALASK